MTHYAYMHVHIHTYDTHHTYIYTYINNHPYIYTYTHIPYIDI